MEQITLNTTTRNLSGKKVKILRRKGQIPLVLYGRNFKTLSLSAESKEFQKIANEAGEATIINLNIPEQKVVKALIRQIQKDPVTDKIIHADLYKVDMSAEIETEIPLVFEGIAPAVEELEGNFIINKDTIKVKCLPDKLVPEIQVDISVLKTFDDLIHIKDLNVPQDIQVLEESDDIVAQVTAPMSEEELQKIEEGAAAAQEKEQIENLEAQAEQEKAEKEEEKETEEKTEVPTQTENEK